MAVISDEVAEFVQNERLGYVATVSPDCKPNLSPKGSVIRSGPESLAFAEIRSPDTIENIESNDAVEVSVISPIIRRGYMFSGRGHVHKDGALFDDLVKKFRGMGIQSPINAVVVIDVEHIRDTRSPLYDLGYTEEQIRDTWKRTYFENS